MKQNKYKVPSLCKKNNTQEYGVTRDGHVWRFPYIVTDKRGKTLSYKGKWVATCVIKVNRNRCYKVFNVGGSLIYLHRILAEVFVPNPEKYTLVYFLDGNTYNVTVDNLTWGTQAMLMQHNYDSGRMEEQKRRSAEKKIINDAIKYENYLKKHKEKKAKIFGCLKPSLDLGRRGSRIIHKLCTEEATQSSISRELKVSRERIRQILNEECKFLGLDYSLVLALKPHKKAPSPRKAT